MAIAIVLNIVEELNTPFSILSTKGNVADGLLV